MNEQAQDKLIAAKAEEQSVQARLRELWNIWQLALVPGDTVSANGCYEPLKIVSVDDSAVRVTDPRGKPLTYNRANLRPWSREEESERVRVIARDALEDRVRAIMSKRVTLEQIAAISAALDKLEL